MELFVPSSIPQAASGSTPELFGQAEHPSKTVVIGLALKIWVRDASSRTEHPSVYDAIGQASDHVNWGMLSEIGKVFWKKTLTTRE